MANRLPSITIIRDTREKDGQGWIFEPEEKKPGRIQVLGTEVGTMDAADYSLAGYPELVAIERKQGFGELFGNLTNKEHKERFERELEKLRRFKHKYLIIEGSLSNDILGMSVPQMQYNAPPAKRIVQTLLEYQLEYGLIPVWAGDAGKKIARYIFDAIARKYLV